MAKQLKHISSRIKELEATMSSLDGKKARKPRKKKVFTLDNLPATKGFGGKIILKDGHYGDYSVYFGKVYTRATMTDDETRSFLYSLRNKMMERFGEFNTNFDDTIKVIEVDNSHLRKRRKKDAVLPDADNNDGLGDKKSADFDKDPNGAQDSIPHKHIPDPPQH